MDSEVGMRVLLAWEQKFCIAFGLQHRCSLLLGLYHRDSIFEALPEALGCPIWLVRGHYEERRWW